MLLLADAAAAAERRVALVIGNANYLRFPALANPRNDAEDVTVALQRVGFEVFGGVNLTREETRDKLRQFARAAQGADAALAYYAGHGLQYKGRNYIVPIDAKLQDEFDLEYETVRIDDVVNELARSNGPKILVLDSCRNLPLTEKSSRNQFIDVGLAKISGRGLVVAYATQANAVAYDGRGRNSVFTQEFLKLIDQPGIDLPDFFQRVSVAVDRQTGGRQTPEVSLSYPGSFYFNPSETDRDVWRHIRETADPEKFRIFILKYPNSDFVDAATATLERIEASMRHVREGKDRAVEQERAAAEARQRKLAEEQAVEAKRIAEQERAAAEARQRKLAEERAVAEAERIAEQERLATEARQRKLTEERAAAEAKRIAEQERAAAEARQRKLTEERAAAEAKRIAEQERAAAEARQRRLTEEQAAEAKRIAEQEHLAAETRQRKIAEEQAIKSSQEIERFAALENGKKAAGPFATTTPGSSGALDRSTDLMQSPHSAENLIRTAQIELRRIECYDGPVNGVLNEATRDAVQKYARQNSLQWSGDIGENVVQWLKRSESGSCSDKSVIFRKSVKSGRHDTSADCEKLSARARLGDLRSDEYELLREACR